MAEIDVTPGAHSLIDAIGTVSFKLACGCTIAPIYPNPNDPEDRLFLHKRPGSEIDCDKHGSQVITRSTQRLTGWATPDPVTELIRASLRGKK